MTAEATRRPGAVRGWLQLLRVPNLLTVPGDPLAGFSLVWATGLTTTRPGVRMALAAGVALLLYMAGLLWNDWFDLAEDTVERPHRPLPGGAVRPVTAALTANVLTVLAIAVAAVAGRPTLYVTMALGATVLAYDGLLKRSPLLGPLAMGACRGLSVLLGAAAFGGDGLANPLLLVHVAGVAFYVAAVTWLAAGETKRRPVKPQMVAVIAALGAWFLGLWLLTVQQGAIHPPLPVLVAEVLAAFWMTRAMVAMGPAPQPVTVQKTVGHLIRTLVIMQAAAILVCPDWGLPMAAAVLAAGVGSWLLGRWFYAS